MGPKRIKRMEKQGEAPIRQPKLQDSSRPLLKQEPQTKGKLTDLENSIIAYERPKLIKTGLTDGEISKELEKKLPGRTVKPIYQQIRRLIRKGKLEENPNKVLGFTDNEKSIIASSRSELIKTGLTDRAIAIKLTKILSERTLKSINNYIIKSVRDKNLEENPNKVLGFTDNEKSIIASSRSELIKTGLTDWKIARQLSKELHRSFFSISHKIWDLVRSGELEANPNRITMRDFTEHELSLIKLKRASWIKDGLTDTEIATKLSKDIHRSTKSINNKILKLVRLGELDANPNKLPREDFTGEVLTQIVSVRSDLILKGLVDFQIAMHISSEFHRPIGSINNKIRALVLSGALEENLNRRGGQCSVEDAKSQIEALLSRLEPQDQGE